MSRKQNKILKSQEKERPWTDRTENEINKVGTFTKDFKD